MRVEFVDFLFEAVLLVKSSGGFLYSFFVITYFGFNDSHFVRIVKPAFDAVQSDGVDAVVHQDVVILYVRNPALLYASFLPASHCEKQER